MKKLFLISACLMATFFSSIAQINYDGQPISWSLNLTSKIPSQTMPNLDLSLLKAEDKANDLVKDSPYRFGKDHAVDIDFFDEAKVTSHQGTSIYQMAIYCPDAMSVSFLFDDFNIPEGGSLFVYNEDRSELKGAFTSSSNKKTGMFPVGLIIDKKVIIEYNGPSEGAILHISQVTHGYRKMLTKWDESKGQFGDSEGCHVNVNCPEGNGWQDQKRSVVLIVEGGQSHCSGAVVSNTLQDGTPYVLTANHCLGAPAGWVFYFNHESADCTGNTGPITESISGATLLANRTLSDFALIELSSPIPASYNVYFSGWDNSDLETVTSAVGIHHPRGDVKKISFDFDNPTTENNVLNYEVWRIHQWEIGVTEGGSSGSPLYDQNGRIIGQLNGGSAGCIGPIGNGYQDYYGRFGVSWDGPNASSRLKDWLDPNSSGVTILDGYGPSDSTYNNDAVSVGVSGIPAVNCNLDPFVPSFTFKNNGTSTITAATILSTYNGSAEAPINWTGSLAPLQTATVQLNSLTKIPGVNSIEVVISDVNGVSDEEISDNAITKEFTVESSIVIGSDINFEIYTDDYGYETSWRVRDVNGADISSGGLYSSYDQFTNYFDTIPISIDGCYQFVIFDNYGDGICCGQGQGYYNLSDINGTLLHTGGDFGDFEKVTFRFDSSLVTLEENDLVESFNVFPNPTNGLVNITSSSTEKYDIQLINAVGQILQSEDDKVGSFIMDITDLPSGAYFLELTSNGIKSFKKVVLN